jgi:lipopolysaccharide transport system ATP-binding protein
MSDAIISVENLGKKYRLSHHGERQRYVALRDVIASKFKSLFQNRKPETGNGKSVEDFWALKDVSFEVKQGEVVGIIGRNGAGKSTLLKILSRITEPSNGRVTMRGRVASLLEVGTGFHPELTGRENIFLNGAILGMSRAEIRKKFDEIVTFAEVEKFLDTPVKRYSSGMYVRLAFAVAAHLEPEILIVDEVLAVGDAEFQKKCLGKMQDVSTKEGRTVLFVSHNMDAIRSLCRAAILLLSGKIAHHSDTETVLSFYQHLHSIQVDEYCHAGQMPTPRLEHCWLTDNGRKTSLFRSENSICVNIVIDSGKESKVVSSLKILNHLGICIIHTSDEFDDVADHKSMRSCIIPANTLAPGEYTVNIEIHRRNVALFASYEAVLAFKVEFTGILAGITRSTDWKGLLHPSVVKWNSFV